MNLLHVDLSGNKLTGFADILFSPSRHLHLSHNNFSSVGYLMKSSLAYKSIEVIDLSHNNLKQAASAVFHDIPPNLRGSYISDNLITGTFPNPFPTLMRMEHFHASNNFLTGPVIEFSHSMPRVSTVDLSHQKSRGLYGSLPSDIPSLLDLLRLDLSSNKLTGTIPAGMANIPRLELLNLSKNVFKGKIPSKLGQLAGECHISLVCILIWMCT